MRFALSIVLCLVVAFAFVGLVSAEDKEVKLSGAITCGKCDLKKDAKCATVIVVKEKDKDVVYYFDPAGHKKYHADVCTESKEGTVVGAVSEKDGKKIITVTKLDYKK